MLVAAWRLSCCGPSWSSLCSLVGAGCGGSSVASLAAAAVVGVCVGGVGRAARRLSPGAGCLPGPLWGGGAFLLLPCKIYCMYSTFMYSEIYYGHCKKFFIFFFLSRP